MQVNISGHHIELTDALKDYVNEKTVRLERHFNNITNVHVTLTKDNYHHKAEATLNIAGQKSPIVAHFDSKDMYESIDKMIDKLDRQVIRHKEKLKDHGDDDLL